MERCIGGVFSKFLFCCCFFFLKKFSFFPPLLFSGVLVMGIFIHKSLDSGIQVGAFHGKYPRSYLENKKIYSIMQIAAVRIEC